MTIPGTPPRVVVFVRDGCHLCADALDTVARVCADLAVDWTSVDIDADPALRARYTDHVPVTVVDGRQLALWFLDEARLRTALADRGAPPPVGD